MFCFFNTLVYVFSILLTNRTSALSIANSPVPNNDPAYIDLKISAIQFLVIRSVYATILTAALINVNFKKFLYDDCKKKDIFPIAFRSVQGTITTIINFVASS